METKDYILASAQRLVQQRGFNGFSYADVAQEVGIRWKPVEFACVACWPPRR